MENWQEFFRGRRITVMGLGLLGGIGDIVFLAEQGAELTVTDLKSPDELRVSILELARFPNIKYTLGRHDLADFSAGGGPSSGGRGPDLVVMAPSTPLDSVYIAEARKNKIPITMWAALFARFARHIGAPIIGVTGTRGKTTTTEMIAHVLRTANKKIIVGGNVKGTAVLPYLPALTSETYVVLELDSWKIQGFREERLSPDVAVFTTFYADHLNYYRGDAKRPRDLGAAMNLYLADKAEIFLHQGESDTLVLGEQAAPIVMEAYDDRIKSRMVIAHAADLPKEWKLKIPGEHNRGNAACAMHALRPLGITDDQIKLGLESFAGVPDRLELVREIKGVSFYNDTTATTPEATIAALRALDPDRKRNIILIMGGSEKNLNMDELLDEIPKHCKKVLLLAGAGTERILPSLLTTTYLLQTTPFDSLQSAIAAARQVAEPGDVVLMSPAFASFGMFCNEYDRGEQFRTLVQSL